MAQLFCSSAMKAMSWKDLKQSVAWKMAGYLDGGHIVAVSVFGETQPRHLIERGGSIMWYKTRKNSWRADFGHHPYHPYLSIIFLIFVLFFVFVFFGWCGICHFMHYFEFLIEIQTEKVCPDPGIPEGGHRFGYRTVGSTMQFSCQAGYKLHGSAVRTCLENKEWSGSLTTCQNGSKWILPVTMIVTSCIFFHRYIWITEMNNGSSHITA